MSQDVQVRVPSPEPSAARRPTRYWAVTAVGMLLLVQAAVLLAIGLYNLVQAGEAPSVGALIGRMESSLGVVLGLLAPLTLAAAVACLTARRSAWSLAILTQGLGLLAGLLLYVSEGSPPAYVFLVAAYHIFLVLYLNSWDVQASFRARTARVGAASVGEGVDGSDGAG